MSFTEWFNEDDHDLYNYPEEAMQEAWNAALEKVGRAIHYPECWDTMAYPTLLDALKEIGCNPDHCTT